MSNTDAKSFARLLRLRAEAEPLRIEVAGSSMGRTIVSGSAVWVVGSPRPRWGEIWAFCEPSAQVEVHRSVGRRGSWNRFWGDGNLNADALVADELLIGRVIAIEPPAGGYTRLTGRDRFVGACIVGARRLPRRLWYRGLGVVRRVVPSRRTKGS